MASRRMTAMVGDAAVDAEAPIAVPPEVRLALTRWFLVTVDGGEVDIPPAGQRLVAFLALRGQPMERAHVAGSLWPETREKRAQASLRSALWRVRLVCPLLIHATRDRVALGGAVTVDINEVTNLARRVVDEDAWMSEEQLDERCLLGDLLPGWYDEFVEFERERLRQLRLHGLEAMVRRLAGMGSISRALDIAIAVIAAEPLRESAHRLVIELHLREGNVEEAARHHGIAQRVLSQPLDQPWETALLPGRPGGGVPASLQA